MKHPHIAYPLIPFRTPRNPPTNNIIAERVTNPLIEVQKSGPVGMSVLVVLFH